MRPRGNPCGVMMRTSTRKLPGSDFCLSGDARIVARKHMVQVMELYRSHSGWGVREVDGERLEFHLHPTSRVVGLGSKAALFEEVLARLSQREMVGIGCSAHTRRGKDVLPNAKVQPRMAQTMFYGRRTGSAAIRRLQPSCWAARYVPITTPQRTPRKRRP